MRFRVEILLARNMERLSEILRRNREAFVMKIRMRSQYFNDNSSLQSVGYVISMTRTPLFKRMFWLVTISACCYGSATVLRGALGLYIQDAVSYSVETDYLKWDTPFPAITICEQSNTTKIKNVLVKQYKSTTLTNFMKDVAFWNSLYCKPCANCKLGVSCIEDFLPIVDLIRSPCEDLMTECSYNGEDFPCCERFKPMATEYGECFVFNSQITGDGLAQVNRVVGLPSLTFTLIAKSTIKVHSPAERVSVATENIFGNDNNCYTLVGGMNLEVNLVAEEIVNDMSVHSIAPGSRDCLFEDEVPKTLDGWPFEEYSYSGCAWYCRAMAQVAICNCTSHFMPKLGKIPVCNVHGLKCLYTNRGSIEVDKNCKCPMSCSEVTYNVVSLKCPILPDSQEVKGHIKIGQLPHLRVRRQAIRDMLGLVVDIGGVVGVFFGASLLSFIEIVYIFCMRKYHSSY